MLRERDMEALAIAAELRALRAQVNPHFLFNALTTHRTPDTGTRRHAHATR